MAAASCSCAAWTPGPARAGCSPARRRARSSTSSWGWTRTTCPTACSTPSPAAATFASGSRSRSRHFGRPPGSAATSPPDSPRLLPWRSRRPASAWRPTCSASRSRRCGRGTTPTPTSTTRRPCSRRRGTGRAFSCRSSRSTTRCLAASTRRSRCSGCARASRGPTEPVLTIEGDYALFAHLETVYLGCLARRTLVMRNVREVVDAARGKPIFYFPARHDHWLVQTGDGWAAHVAGAIGVSTDAQASGWGGRGIGTVPHALIAAFGGDTVAAARAFAKRYAGEMNVTVLVDFENDSVRTSLEVADALGDDLWGVRLDTSERLVDRALWTRMGDFRPSGVNPVLVHRVRDALDAAGHERVKIVVSGGFDA